MWGGIKVSSADGMANLVVLPIAKLNLAHNVR